MRKTPLPDRRAARRPKALRPRRCFDACQNAQQRGFPDAAAAQDRQKAPSSKRKESCSKIVCIPFSPDNVL
jgi:hypothetical protein